MTVRRSLRARRGSSFIEILVALAILAVLMVGILQMFSLALLTNGGSAARTDLLYKAQQVVENLRLAYALESLGNPAARTAAGLPATIVATTTPIYLPYRSSDPNWAYWGPNGANVVDEERLPYRLSYTVENRDANFWLVTVTATPVDNPRLLPSSGGSLPVPTTALNPRRYLSLGSKLKIVTYSAQIEK
ncbi:MAG: prepilin-type N-terminal cleavage/methylation domain-containing protein [Holophagales bacterium]|nr:prepilin-type N-terminal cleavage/methylation domain-containing protein [Holophagales bacterium]MBK9376315.1 prepilin-type N-terminal cleavage/methylation domain-containing protein [Holophagales bacterium]